MIDKLLIDRKINRCDMILYDIIWHMIHWLRDQKTGLCFRLTYTSGLRWSNNCCLDSIAEHQVVSCPRNSSISTKGWRSLESCWCCWFMEGLRSWSVVVAPKFKLSYKGMAPGYKHCLSQTSFSARAPASWKVPLTFRPSAMLSPPKHSNFLTCGPFWTCPLRYTVIF